MCIRDRSTQSTWEGCIIIGSKLDFDVNIKQCRIAFEGEILDILSEPQLNAISLLRNKTRVGKIEKVLDGNTLLIKELFKKETNFDIFLGKKVRIAKLGIEGVLDSTFGKSGKVKVVTSSLIPPEKYEELVNSEVEMTIQKRLFKSKKPAKQTYACLLYTSPSPRDLSTSRMPSSA
eukprot:TRINITY_DN11161_c0_g1_i1.p2 TRINITY_DN11161_c0_g1~~TRINITY_DN11161_c0_g1_i1.p2  ORF type:complete len:176 (-),score=39.23 TRINITY_DN11161_c0_g1_i1:130-657(-)